MMEDGLKEMEFFLESPTHVADAEYQVEHPLWDILGNASNFRFLFLKYLLIHNETDWGLDLSINFKSVYIPCIPCTRSQKVILDSISK